MNPKSRFKGALMGLAVGDALGTTLEFLSPGSFAPIADMVGGGPFRLKPGYWTDDGSMALCLAASLIQQPDFDTADQLTRYCNWWQHGYMSSNGKCFDIGVTVHTALSSFLSSQSTGLPGPTDPSTAGNGSLMRLCPVPMAYLHNPEAVIRLAALSSQTTHGAPECLDACRYFGLLLWGALSGLDKEILLSADFWEKYGQPYSPAPLAPRIAAIAKGSFKEKQPPAIKGSGYVVKSLEAALWAFHNQSDFRAGALAAVNLGDDADTTGAIYGQIAGAHYGFEGIPDQWVRLVVEREEGCHDISGQIFLDYAEQLYAKTTGQRTVHTPH